MTNFQIAMEAIKQYAQLKPRPLHVTQKQAAEMLNLSVPTIRKMVASGELKLNKCGLIHISEIDKVLASRA